MLKASKKKALSHVLHSTAAIETPFLLCDKMTHANRGGTKKRNLEVSEAGREGCFCMSRYLSEERKAYIEKC